MEIDLDAIRQARLDAQPKSKKHRVKFAGKRFPISAETPWDLAFGLATNDSMLIVDGVKEALGDGWDEFKALGPSVDDVVDLALAINALGRTPGESKASRGSSSTNSRRSRPTSNGSIR